MNGIRLVLFFLFCVIVFVAYYKATTHIQTNIDFITIIMSPSTHKKVVSSVGDVWNTFYITFGGLVTSSALFLLVLQQIVFVSKERFRSIYVPLFAITLVIIALSFIGYCAHLSMMNPIHERVRAYGQPNYDFSLEALDFRGLFGNPFVYPTVGFVLATLGLYPLYMMISVLRHAYSQKWLKDTHLRNLYKKKQNYSKILNLKFYGTLLGIAFFFFVILLFTGSAFTNNLTWVEIPKVLFLMGTGGLLAELARNRTKDKYLLLFGLIFFVPIMIVMVLLNDSGAILILLFAGALIVASAILDRYLPIVGLLIYLGLKFAQAGVIDIHKYLTTSGERLQDWQIDNFFVTSGQGMSYIPETASSTDFAKSFWGLASGGFWGRDTALFFYSTNDDTVLHSITTAGYDDRVASILIEVYGFFGLCMILCLYAILLYFLLRLFKTPQKGFFIGFGFTLGLVSIIFGQVMVHIGGNFNFIPFTGIVLPFISRSGMAFLVMMLAFTGLIALYLPTPPQLKSLVHRDDPDDGVFAQLVGMQWFIFISFTLVLGSVFYYVIWKGDSFSNSIRYDINEDLYVKEVYNPRLFLLTEGINVKGKIKDMNDNLVRDSNGTYLYELFDKSDYFLHTFETEKRSTLEGIQQENSEYFYYKQVCSLPNGDYTQFAGLTEESVQESVKNFFTKNGYSHNPIQEGWNENCVVKKVQKGGTLYKNRYVGEPVDSSDYSKGCKVNETIHTKGKNNTIWFFTENQKEDVEKFVNKKTATPPTPVFANMWKKFNNEISVQDSIKTWFSESGNLDVCVVTEWHVAIETRKGIMENDQCVVTTPLDGSQISYKTNMLNGGQLPPYHSILGVDIESSTDNVCEVTLHHVGCKFEDSLLGPQKDIDRESGIARVSLQYSGGNRLTFGDEKCSSIVEELGVLKSIPDGDDSSQIKLSKKYFAKNKSNIAGIDIAEFAGLSLERQLEQQKQMKEELEKIEEKIYLDAKLQSEIRQLLSKQLVKFDAPSVQALVFETETGRILSQVQVSKIRNEQLYLDAEKEKKYFVLYTDQGEYGYGINQLAVKYVPASAFKIYHALAAVSIGVNNFEHTCVGEGYLPIGGKWVDGGSKKIQDFDHVHHGKLDLKQAIVKSCNQYFASLSIEKTHPDALRDLCTKKNLQFGYDSALCALGIPKSYTAGLNGYGQSLVMDVYQLGGLLQAVSTNKQPNLQYKNYITGEKAPDTDSLLFNTSGVKYILDAMKGHEKAIKITKEIPGVRAYGKTGTGDRDISIRKYTTEKQGPYITLRKKNSKNKYWEENLEAPYGVIAKRSSDGNLSASNMNIFILLLEDSDYEENQLETPRIGVVVRVPRTNTGRTTGGSVAAPIAQEITKILVKQNLIPQKP